LTYSNNNQWTNNTGGTVKVIVTYSLAWNDGDGGAGNAKGTAIFVNRNRELAMHAPSVNNSRSSDPLRHSATTVLTLAAGDYIVLSATQNTSSGTINVGTGNVNGQTYGAIISITQLP
jgi:hypothetical protein